MYAEERIKPSCARKPLRESCKALSAPRDGQEGVAKRGISVRLACVVYVVSETCHRYQATLDGENALVADWLLKLTQTYKGWSFGLLLVSEQCEGLLLEPKACVPHLPGARIEPAY